jgi:hypothetical protein
VDLVRDFELLIGLMIAIAGIAAAFIVRGWLLKIVVLVIALLVAVYVAGLWDQMLAVLP